jgi:hypothetical protein
MKPKGLAQIRSDYANPFILCFIKLNLDDRQSPVSMWAAVVMATPDQ